MKSEDKFLSSDMYQNQAKSPERNSSFDLVVDEKRTMSVDKPEEVKMEDLPAPKNRTARGSNENDDDEGQEFRQRRSKRDSKKTSTSVSQIFALGDKRSAKPNQAGAPSVTTENKATKNALMNVIKNPNTFGLGQNLGNS